MHSHRILRIYITVLYADLVSFSFRHLNLFLILQILDECTPCYLPNILLPFPFFGLSKEKMPYVNPDNAVLTITWHLQQDKSTSTNINVKILLVGFLFCGTIDPFNSSQLSLSTRNKIYASLLRNSTDRSSVGERSLQLT